jgi:Tfp pilus assembly protein PilV
MCAVVILGVALVGLTQGITTALSCSKESELQTTAALIAAGQIEELRASGIITDGETEGSGGEGLSLYHWKETITSTSTDGLHEVTVAVDHARTGKEIYELRTLLFDPPVDSTPKSDRKGSSRSNPNRTNTRGGRQ